MIVERENNEILVRLSPQTNTSDLQDMLLPGLFFSFCVAAKKDPELEKQCF